MLDQSIFRAYDIRGIVGETLTEEDIFLIGKVLGSIVLEGGEHQLTIARDGRLSGVSLLSSLSQGILSSGCDVIELGMVPTPLLYYATHLFEHRSGVMLTGSHNPSNYNGLKIVMKGKSFAGDSLTQLYHRIQKKDWREGEGTRYETNVVDRYVRHVVHDIHIKRPLKIVVDAGNGVAGQIVPALYRELGCEVHEIFCEVDGRFPHHHPDPSQPENLQDLIETVRKEKADIGLAFDGDGDRLGVVTSYGEIIWPDRLLLLFARSMLKKHANATILYDVKCTYHLGKFIQEWGGNPLMWKTGHSLIKSKMAETQALLAGEMSGHFFFRDRWYGFDDALYAGARLLEIIAEQQQDSCALFKTIPDSVSTPELKIFVEEKEKAGLMETLINCANFKDAKDIMTIDGLRVNFTDGWGLVRMSNTSPCLILRFEATNENILQQIQSLFRTWMQSVKADWILPF